MPLVILNTLCRCQRQIHVASVLPRLAVPIDLIRAQFFTGEDRGIPESPVAVRRFELRGDLDGMPAYWEVYESSDKGFREQLHVLEARYNKLYREVYHIDEGL